MGGNLKKYMWILSVAAAVAVGYFLARMAGLFVAGYFPDVVIPATPPKGATGAVEYRKAEIDVEAIIARNFFDSKESDFGKPTGPEEAPPEKPVTAVKEEPPQNQEATETSLNVKLISTIAVGDGRDKLSSCVIESGRAAEVFAVGADPSFAPDTKITRILPKRVEFLHKKKLEYVALVDYAKGMNPRSKPERSALLDRKTQSPRRVTREETPPEEEKTDIQREGNSFSIPKAEVDKALARLDRLYTEIRAVPYFKNGKANGFKLINVKGGSLFEKLGMRRGDILKSINGTVLDIQTGLNTFNTLKNESSFTLEVERRGVEQTFTYQIVN